MKNEQDQRQPFFAQFLEDQIKEEPSAAGGEGAHLTQPIVDNVTIPERDSVTKPSSDMAQTLKYPSDGDDDVPGFPM